MKRKPASETLDLIRKNPGLTRQEIAKRQGVSIKNVYSIVRRLRHDVRVEGGKGRTAGRLYALDAKSPGAVVTGATEPKRKDSVSATLRDFALLCEAADLEIGAGLALAYRLIVQHLIARGNK